MSQARMKEHFEDLTQFVVESVLIERDGKCDCVAIERNPTVFERHVIAGILTGAASAIQEGHDWFTVLETATEIFRCIVENPVDVTSAIEKPLRQWLKATKRI